MECETRKLAVKANSEWIDKILWSGFSIAAVVVLARLLGIEEIPFQGTKIAWEHSWVIFLVFIFAHLYATLLFVHSIENLRSQCDLNTQYNTFLEITATGGVFFRGMKPRLIPEGGNSAIASASDIPIWLGLISTILLFVAIVPYKLGEKGPGSHIPR